MGIVLAWTEQLEVEGRTLGLEGALHASRDRDHNGLVTFEHGILSEEQHLTRGEGLEPAHSPAPGPAWQTSTCRQTGERASRTRSASTAAQRALT